MRGKSFIWSSFHKRLKYGGDSIVHVGTVLKRECSRVAYFIDSRMEKAVRGYEATVGLFGKHVYIMYRRVMANLSD